MEKENLLKQTLFKTPYGSRLYGTNGPNSDTDWKYIFLPPLKDTLLGKQIMKTKFMSPNETDKTKQVDEDFIPIQKFAYDFLKGVPYAIEVAFSYHFDSWLDAEKMHAFLFVLQKKFLNKKLSGFLGFVNNIHHRLQTRQSDELYRDGKPIDPKDVYHGMRVAMEASELLLYGKLSLPLPHSKLLKEVKNGNVNPSMYFELVNREFINMEAALEKTTLQELTSELEEEFEQWLYEQLFTKFYNLRER